jgi:hypothetical protein
MDGLVGDNVVTPITTSDNNRGAVFSVRGRCRRFITDTINRLLDLDLKSCKENAMWPEEELEDLVRDVTCSVVQRYWECVI